MNVVTVASHIEIVQEGQRGDGNRRFQHGLSHLNIHLLNQFRYCSPYVTFVLLEVLLQAIVAEVQCDREVSIHQLENFHSFCSFIIFVDPILI